MSIVNRSSIASASEPVGNSRTLQVQAEAVAPVAHSSAIVEAAESAPLTHSGFDVVAVAELRRQAMLDALDPGPRPDAADRPRARGFLARIKSFYAQELIHDTAAHTENAERTSQRGKGKGAESPQSNG
ncbi:hypothetical protein [Streptomyces sp. NBC_00859]|uniref:hypothetical protein n=1 Tax=Streptomyces sp. NBC_00859 TaxID=2903682 RepID=UPI00386DEFB6|nr:hypothetical protein OG584_02825 [Streptomyces sp. NBC_00859]